MNKLKIKSGGMKNDGFFPLSFYWDEPISCFANVKSKSPKQILLKHWIRACTKPSGEKELRHKSICQEIRATGNKELKQSLPAISPGAVVTSRDKDLNGAEKIAKVTGWMQFDIDLKDNLHITDARQLRDEIKKIVFVAFCSISVSGKGVWGLVRVKSTETYKLHYEQLKIDFASRKIFLDPSKGGNPTDLRIYTYDPDAYIAEQFRIYDRLYRPPPPIRKHINSSKNSSDTRKQVEKLVTEIQAKRIDIAPDYNSYLSIGFAFANEFGEEGRSLFHAGCSVSPKYNESDAESKYTDCINSKTDGSRITIATFFFLCKEAGLNFTGSPHQTK